MNHDYGILILIMQFQRTVLLNDTTRSLYLYSNMTFLINGVNVIFSILQSSISLRRLGGVSKSEIM